jgi:ribonuclease-3
MDEKGMRNEWNHNPKILEDAFEALVGAIYMDLGLLHTKEFILRIYNDPQFVNLDSIMVDDNFKDHLMRYCQSNGLQLPVYSIVRHDSGVFYIAVFVDNVCVGQGYAKNKKLGEQYAAKSFFYPPVVPTSLNSLGVHY